MDLRNAPGHKFALVELNLIGKEGRPPKFGKPALGFGIVHERSAGLVGRRAAHRIGVGNAQLQMTGTSPRSSSMLRPRANRGDAHRTLAQHSLSRQGVEGVIRLIGIVVASGGNVL